MAQRIFKYDGRGKKSDFNVTTKLTDTEAINLLTGGKGIQPGTESETFAEKCAFEIHKLAAGFRARGNMIAWGFKLAEEKANPVPASCLSASVLSMVRFRKPLKGEVDGEPFKVSLCGARSRHSGKYTITDGGPFGQNRFYGYAEPNGAWTPARVTPPSVVAKLTGKE